MTNKPKIIGITGGSGAGKGEVCRILAEYGVQHIDADKLAHTAILRGFPAYNEVLAAFGRDILQENGEISRKKLGAIVFADKTKLAVLSQIVHKYVQLKCEEIIANTVANTVAIDAAALVEAGMHLTCDAVWGIFAPINTRISRITTRDNISADAAKKRILSQMPDDALRKIVHVSFENNENLTELHNKIKEELEKL